MDPKPSPLRLGTTSGRTFIQVVWGNVINNNGQTIVNIPHNGVDGKRGRQTVASKLIPVAFAEGAWIRDSSGANATFEVDMDTSPGQTVSLQARSLTDAGVSGSYLKAYRDPNGTQEINLNESFTIPQSGVLVLYFTGNFEAVGAATYNISSRLGGDPFALKVYQPKFEFVNDNNEIIPQNQRFGSDPAKGGNAANRFVYVGTALNRKIAAFDPVDGGICTTCTFAPREMKTESFVRTGGTNSRADAIIQFPEKRLINGIGNLSLFSLSRIQPENDSIGFFTIGGPSVDPSTFARWDSLQFREPPVLYPVSAEIFDRNGDGKGDSIRIVYNRAFPADTLPNKLQVVWSLRDTVSFGLAQKNANGQYTNTGFSAADNANYWAKYLRKGGTCRDCADTIVIATDNFNSQFSSSVKTAAYGGEVVASWSTFMDETGISITSSFSSAIKDRIPPIIVAAEYARGSGVCGAAANNPCQDIVYIMFSERVEVADKAKEKEAFAYKLIAARGSNATFEVYKEGKSLPAAMLWADSIVRLTYRSYKTADDNSYTPALGDSVRLLDKLGSNPLTHALRDLAGNFPNPNETGRRIVGYNPSPIAISKTAIGQIIAKAISNTIMLGNLPANSKVQVYNLYGKLVYNSQAPSSNSQSINVRAKGLYIVKVRFGNSNGEILKVLVK
jgi:hypothetical protein